jgi:hypothetical protein
MDMLLIIGMPSFHTYAAAKTFGSLPSAHLLKTFPSKFPKES